MINGVITQNVDTLHDQAGSHGVIELHGSLHWVLCLDCRQRTERDIIQQTLMAQNPYLASVDAVQAPDGDTLLDEAFEARFQVPHCPHCGGDRMKPDVVFFGEGVPRARVELAMTHLRRADAMLVVGSSLMVYSGYRFCERAAILGKPIVAINRGRTRADHLFAQKIEAPCGSALEALLAALG